MTLLIPCSIQATESKFLRTVLSFEGAYFHPRRAKFRDFYGEGLPALSVRLDTKLRGKSSLSFKMRALRMKKFEELEFTNLTASILLKIEQHNTGNAIMYIAFGPQFEVRFVKFPVGRSTFLPDATKTQTDLMPSLAFEGGIDLWLSSSFKISPHVVFSYFPPFVDPTRGNFGDTGGFDLALGVGFGL